MARYGEAPRLALWPRLLLVMIDIRNTYRIKVLFYILLIRTGIDIFNLMHVIKDN